MPDKGGLPMLKYYTDSINFGGASGWVFAESGPVSCAKAISNQNTIAKTLTFHPRPDLAAHYSGSSGAKQFWFQTRV
jgi:hypothetical protein